MSVKNPKNLRHFACGRQPSAVRQLAEFCSAQRVCHVLKLWKFHKISPTAANILAVGYAATCVLSSVAYTNNTNKLLKYVNEVN